MLSFRAAARAPGRLGGAAFGPARASLGVSPLRTALAVRRAQRRWKGTTADARDFFRSAAGNANSFVDPAALSALTDDGREERAAGDRNPFARRVFDDESLPGYDDSVFEDVDSSGEFDKASPLTLGRLEALERISRRGWATLAGGGAADDADAPPSEAEAAMHARSFKLPPHAVPPRPYSDSCDIVADASAAHRFFPLHDTRVAEILPEGLPSELRAALRTTWTQRLMNRPHMRGMLERMKRFEGHDWASRADDSGDSSAVVLTGSRGIGRTASVVHAVHYARTSGWLALYVPDARSFTQGAVARRSNLAEGVYETPKEAAGVLEAFHAAHSDLLARLPQRRRRQYGTRYQQGRTPEEAREFLEGAARRAVEADAGRRQRVRDARKQQRLTLRGIDESEQNWVEDSDEAGGISNVLGTADPSGGHPSSSSSSSLRGVSAGDEEVEAAVAEEAAANAAAANGGGSSAMKAVGEETWDVRSPVLRHPETSIDASRMRAERGELESTLLDIVEYGLRNPDAASAALLDLRLELSLVTEAPVLVAVDGVNAAYEPTGFAVRGQAVPPSRLLAARAVRAFDRKGLRDEFRPRRGMLLCATCDTHSQSDAFYRQVPVKRYASRVPPMGEEETRAMVTLSASTGAKPTYITDSLVGSLRVVSSGIPRELAKELMVLDPMTDPPRATEDRYVINTKHLRRMESVPWPPLHPLVRQRARDLDDAWRAKKLARRVRAGVQELQRRAAFMDNRAVFDDPPLVDSTAARFEETVNPGNRRLLAAMRGDMEALMQDDADVANRAKRAGAGRGRGGGGGGGGATGASGSSSGAQRGVEEVAAAMGARSITVGQEDARQLEAARQRVRAARDSDAWQMEDDPTAPRKERFKRALRRVRADARRRSEALRHSAKRHRTELLSLLRDEAGSAPVGSGASDADRAKAVRARALELAGVNAKDEDAVADVTRELQLADAYTAVETARTALSDLRAGRVPLALEELDAEQRDMVARAAFEAEADSSELFEAQESAMRVGAFARAHAAMGDTAKPVADAVASDDALRRALEVLRAHRRRVSDMRAEMQRAGAPLELVRSVATLREEEMAADVLRDPTVRAVLAEADEDEAAEAEALAAREGSATATLRGFNAPVEKKGGADVHGFARGPSMGALALASITSQQDRGSLLADAVRALGGNPEAWGARERTRYREEAEARAEAAEAATAARAKSGDGEDREGGGADPVEEELLRGNQVRLDGPAVKGMAGRGGHLPAHGSGDAAGFGDGGNGDGEDDVLRLQELAFVGADERKAGAMARVEQALDELLAVLPADDGAAEEGDEGETVASRAARYGRAVRPVADIRREVEMRVAAAERGAAEGAEEAEEAEEPELTAGELDVLDKATAFADALHEGGLMHAPSPPTYGDAFTSAQLPSVLADAEQEPGAFGGRDLLHLSRSLRNLEPLDEEEQKEALAAARRAAAEAATPVYKDREIVVADSYDGSEDYFELYEAPRWLQDSDMGHVARQEEEWEKRVAERMDAREEYYEENPDRGAGLPRNPRK